ncbi:unnamed protein product, partial [Ectocarpus sp. 13 AM-2016]
MTDAAGGAFGLGWSSSRCRLRPCLPAAPLPPLSFPSLWAAAAAAPRSRSRRPPPPSATVATGSTAGFPRILRRGPGLGRRPCRWRPTR